MSELYVRNRQRVLPINLKLLRDIADVLIPRISPTDYSIGVLLVDDREITRLNEKFLRHGGVTDVITFSYSADSKSVEGEVFICVPEAERQAKRFHTTWQQELVRYLVHGLLHLRGYDDGNPQERRRMKSLENPMVKLLAKEFSLRELKGPNRVRG